MGAFTTALSAISPLGGMVSGSMAARDVEKQRLAALRDRQQQIKDSAREQEINKMHKLNNTLSHNMAVQAAKGGGTAGTASFNMMSMSDINNYIADKNADDLSSVFQDKGILSQELAVRQQERVDVANSIAGGISTIGQEMLNMYIPSSAPSPVSALTPKSTPKVEI